MKKTKLSALVVGAVMVGGLLSTWQWNVVREVVDGDTLTLGNGTKVRLVGIDAPELQYCGGIEAKSELEKLVLEKKVSLSQIKVDNFRRLLAVVKVESKVVNLKMVESGWVRWDGTTNEMGKTLGNASDMAREKKMGIYGPKCRESEDKECIIKGNIENRSGTTEGGRKFYFFPGCSEYEKTIVEKEKGEQWFCNEQEAIKAGYTKGTNCFGKKFDVKKYENGEE